MHMGANARRASFIPDFMRLAAKFVLYRHACAEKASERTPQLPARAIRRPAIAARSARSRSTGPDQSPGTVWR